MLKTTLLAVLAFAGVQAVDISSTTQFEMGSPAICNMSAASTMYAMKSGPGSCGSANVGTESHERIVLFTHRAYKRALRSGD